MNYRCAKNGDVLDHNGGLAVTDALEAILDLLAQSRVDADDSMDRLTTDLELLLDEPVSMDTGAGVVDAVDKESHGHLRARIISEVQFYDLLVQRIQRIHGCLEVVRGCLTDDRPSSTELEHRVDETVRFFHESPPPSRAANSDDIVIFFDDVSDD